VFLVSCLINFFEKKTTVIELINPYSIAEGGGNCVPIYSNKCSEIGNNNQCSDPDPLVIGMYPDPDPDPSVIKQK
jgi:hypothetical protein